MRGINFEDSFSKYIRKDGKVTISNFTCWRVRVTENGKRITLGRFKTEEEAIKCLNDYKSKRA